MAQLLLVLPGTEALPILPADTVNRVPARLLEILQDIGHTQDYGNLKIITVQEARYYTIIRSTVEYYTRDRLQHGRITVERATSRGPVVYHEDSHAHNIAFTATPETHELFLEQLRHYMFCRRVGMKEFQAYLCTSICTRLPVYEAEITALVTTLFKDDETLKHTEPDLIKFLFRRVALLRHTLIQNRSLLPFLRSIITTKDYFLSVMDHVATASISDPFAERVFTELGVDEATKMGALLDAFAAKHGTDASQAQNLPRPLAANDPVYDLHNIVVHAGAGHVHSSSTAATPQTHKRRCSSSVNELVRDPTDTKERRQHPGEAMYESGPRTTSSAPRRLLRTRPSSENEYWSVKPEEWEGLADNSKLLRTHVGHICETQAGMVAPEACSKCRELGLVCEVYTQDPRNALFGASCARCRMTRGYRCSHSQIKRTKTVHSG